MVSGIKTCWWLEKLVETREWERQVDGPAFRHQVNSVMSLRELDDYSIIFCKDPEGRQLVDCSTQQYGQKLQLLPHISQNSRRMSTSYFPMFKMQWTDGERLKSPRGVCQGCQWWNTTLMWWYPYMKKARTWMVTTHTCTYIVSHTVCIFHVLYM